MFQLAFDLQTKTLKFIVARGLDWCSELKRITYKSRVALDRLLNPSKAGVPHSSEHELRKTQASKQASKQTAQPYPVLDIPPQRSSLIRRSMPQLGPVSQSSLRGKVILGVILLHPLSLHDTHFEVQITFLAALNFIS
jgi:hypothetical protein